MTKPSTYDTMYVTCIKNQKPKYDYKENKDYYNYIVPLTDIHIKKEEDRVTIKSYIDWGNKVRGKFHRVCIGISDDPFTKWASDYGHLGSFRICFIAFDCDITDKRFLEIKTEPKKLLKKVVIPDRVI